MDKKQTILALLIGVGMFVAAYISSRILSNLGYEEGIWFCVPILFIVLGAGAIGSLTMQSKFRREFRCSKCGTKIANPPEPGGFTTCPQCGALLRRDQKT